MYDDLAFKTTKIRPAFGPTGKKSRKLKNARKRNIIDLKIEYTEKVATKSFRECNLWRCTAPLSPHCAYT